MHIVDLGHGQMLMWPDEHSYPASEYVCNVVALLRRIGSSPYYPATLGASVAGISHPNRSMIVGLLVEGIEYALG